MTLSSLAWSLALLTACPNGEPPDDGVEDAGAADDAGLDDAGPGDAGLDDAGPGDGGLVDLVETAQAAGDFNTLLSALEDADLADTLVGEGPFTVLAPTDEAFDRLPSGTLAALDMETLSTILQQHVIDGMAPASTILEEEQIDPLAGGPIQIDVVDDEIVLNGTATVTARDIEASNGVIHALDGVLIPQDMAFPGNTAEALSSYPRFSSLLEAADRAGLLDDLEAEGPLTIFAPSNEAFEALGVSLDALTDEQVAEILSYHVVPQAVLEGDAVPGSTITSLGGAPIALGVTAQGLRLNSAADVTYADFETENGVIHVINQVLTPPGNLIEAAIQQGRFSTLLTGLESAGLTNTIAEGGPYTIFAPTNEAFAAFPEGALATLDQPGLTNLLQHHVLDGIVPWSEVASQAQLTPLAAGPIQVDVVDGVPVLNGTARVFGSNVPASNGLLHFVDGVVFPQDMEFPGTSVQALTTYPRFSTLAEALTTADLAGQLSGAGPFTIFAPSDDAFAEAGIDLATLPTEELADILLNHVVSGEVLAADAVGDATTLQGSTISIAQGEEGLVINDDANITYADFETTNGVIHVIDSVLVPPEG